VSFGQDMPHDLGSEASRLSEAENLGLTFAVDPKLRDVWACQAKDVLVTPDGDEDNTIREATERFDAIGVLESFDR